MKIGPSSQPPPSNQRSANAWHRLHTALGVVVDLSQTGIADNVVSFEPSPSRVSFVLGMWRNASRDRRMSPQFAATLRGKLNFLLEAAAGRVGRAPSLVLVQREHHDSDYSFTPELHHAHEFYEALLPNLPVRKMAVGPANIPPLLIYTDAMFWPRKRKHRLECVADEFSSRFITRLGIVLYDPLCDPGHYAFNPTQTGGCGDGFLFYGSVTPPASVTATFAKSSEGDLLKVYIAQRSKSSRRFLFTTPFLARFVTAKSITSLTTQSRCRV